MEWKQLLKYNAKIFTFSTNFTVTSTIFSANP